MDKQVALLIIKPDGVQRGLIGKILRRFELVGLTIIGMKFAWADRQTISDHYPNEDTWYKKVGERTLTNYEKRGIDVKSVFHTDDAITIGKTVKGWLLDFMQESPLFVVAVKGYEAIEIVRKISGNTVPIFAAPGTVRGDFSHDTIDLANQEGRPLRNLIHASDTVEDGKKEVALWFKDEELFEYERADERIMWGIKS